jgi:intracellular sulfur oxidation DsrE/DsrF family protein
VGRDVLLEAVQSVLGNITSHSGIVKMDAPLRVTRVDVVFHVLGVETLVGDAVAQENKSVSVLEFYAGRDW